jgi:hypothetical protein
MIAYTLTKGRTEYRIQVGKLEGRIVRVVDGKPSTSQEVVRGVEALDRVNELLRQGYKAKRTSNGKPRGR